MRSKGFRVAVIAVDPSSPFSHGAILGDRIRMNDLALDPDVFIRSMGTRGRLGASPLLWKEPLKFLMPAATTTSSSKLSESGNPRWTSLKWLIQPSLSQFPFGR